MSLVVQYCYMHMHKVRCILLLNCLSLPFLILHHTDTLSPMCWGCFAVDCGYSWKQWRKHECSRRWKEKMCHLQTDILAQECRTLRFIKKLAHFQTTANLAQHSITYIFFGQAVETQLLNEVMLSTVHINAHLTVIL